MAPTAVPADTTSDLPVHGKGGVVDRVKENEKTELKLAHDYGAPDNYLDGEKDTLWYNWVGSIYVKPLRFEAKTGKYVIVLKTEPHADLGKHRHRGEVQAYTKSGPWGYQEYPWTAKAGDYIVENPGTIHTLYMGAGSEVVFTVFGSIEFFNDDDTLREIMDGFSFWRMYLEHCEKYDVTPNMNLWY